MDLIRRFSWCPILLLLLSGPALAKDASSCMRNTQTQGNIDAENAAEDHSLMMLQISACKAQMDHEQFVTLQTCLDRSGKTAPTGIVQACSAAISNDALPQNERSFLLLTRADAYLSLGYKPKALDDFNDAIKWAPDNAYLYYNRGAYYAGQSDYDSALRDFNAALGINAKFVPALLQRANIYRVRSNFSGALADYSAAILLQPKNAAVWSERGYVRLRQRDYKGAVDDEAQAIQLDPNLARAYFFRGAAFGELGDSSNAASNINAALRLDPSLQGHLVTQGKSVSLTLPLPP